MQLGVVAAVTISVPLMRLFVDCVLLVPLGPAPMMGPGSIPNSWADVCGFLKHPGSQRFWKVNKHGAFSLPRQALALRANDQSCHHETWLHLHFVDWSNRGTIRLATTGTFASENVLRILEIVLPNVTFARY